MQRRRLLALIAGIVASTAWGHPRHDGAEPLNPMEVDEVLTALAEIGTEALAEGWKPPEGARASLNAAVTIYAAHQGKFGGLPETTERTLLTYDAIAFGWLLPDGSLSPDADALILLQAVHPLDAIAVAERLDDFLGVARLFSVAAR